MPKTVKLKMQLDTIRANAWSKTIRQNSKKNLAMKYDRAYNRPDRFHCVSDSTVC